MEGLPEVRLVRADGRLTKGGSKLGGKPTFVCGEIHEKCCGQEVALFGQFDDVPLFARIQ